MPSVGTSWRRRNPSFVLFVLSAFSVPCSVCVPHSTVNSSTQQAECVFCGRSVFCGLRGEYTGKNQLSRFEHPLPWMLRQTGSLRSPRPTWRIDIPRFPCLFGKTSPSKPCVVHWSEAETVEKNNYPKKVRRKKASWRDPGHCVHDVFIPGFGAYALKHNWDSSVIVSQSCPKGEWTGFIFSSPSLPLPFSSQDFCLSCNIM